MSNLNIPELADGQDEVVFEIVLRRNDEPNPGGNSAGDMGDMLAQIPPPGVVNALLTICAHYGFDSELSYAGVTSVTEVEGPSEPATLAQLHQAVAG